MAFTKIQERILDQVLIERQRQRDMGHGGDTEEFDKGNSQNDWIAYITAYLGRAADKVFRNIKEVQSFEGNMIKVAALALAALEAHAKEYC